MDGHPAASSGECLSCHTVAKAHDKPARGNIDLAGEEGDNDPPTKDAKIAPLGLSRLRCELVGRFNGSLVLAGLMVAVSAAAALHFTNEVNCMHANSNIEKRTP